MLNHKKAPPSPLGGGVAKDLREPFQGFPVPLAKLSGNVNVNFQFTPRCPNCEDLAKLCGKYQVEAIATQYKNLHQIQVAILSSG